MQITSLFFSKFQIDKENDKSLFLVVDSAHHSNPPFCLFLLMSVGKLKFSASLVARDGQVTNSSEE